MIIEDTSYDKLALACISSTGYALLRFASGKDDTDTGMHTEMETLVNVLEDALMSGDLPDYVIQVLQTEINDGEYFTVPQDDTNPATPSDASRETILRHELGTYLEDAVGVPCPHIVDMYARAVRRADA